MRSSPLKSSESFPSVVESARFLLFPAQSEISTCCSWKIRPLCFIGSFAFNAGINVNPRFLEERAASCPCECWFLLDPLRAESLCELVSPPSLFPVPCACYFSVLVLVLKSPLIALLFHEEALIANMMFPLLWIDYSFNAKWLLLILSCLCPNSKPHTVLFSLTM